MSRPETFMRDYSVEVSAFAWGQLSQLPQETYRRIRRELEAVALGLAHLGPPTPAQKMAGQDSSLSLVVGDYLVRYAVEPERRRLSVLEVARCPPREEAPDLKPARSADEQVS